MLVLGVAVVFLGAVIGYVTNYLAIRALFRPRKPIRLLGWTLPLTPGVIPSRRKEIADAIARVIDEELVTEERIQARIEKALDRQLDRALNPSTLFPNLLGRALNRLFEAGFADLKPNLKRNIRRPLSKRITRLVRTHLDAGEIARRQINEMDLEKLEELIVRITRRELRWICWLGAVVGALIGLLQATIILFI